MKPKHKKTPPKRRTQPRKRKLVYTHRDATGMSWRFVGNRPVSALADQVMAECGLPDEGLAFYGPERQIGPA